MVPPAGRDDDVLAYMIDDAINDHDNGEQLAGVDNVDDDDLHNEGGINDGEWHEPGANMEACLSLYLLMRVQNIKDPLEIAVVKAMSTIFNDAHYRLHPDHIDSVLHRNLMAVSEYVYL